MDVFGKVTAIIISILLFFGWPFVYFRMKQEDIADSYILYETVRFVDRVKENGELTDQLYAQYIERMGITGKTMEVELEEEEHWLTVKVSNGLVYGGKIKDESH